ncbi:MAG: preprotein translocase subunit SecA [Anaerolineaceae bacterium]|nr:preprotein translocase subunit SecA [Anaerolineaceae bacterium]
MFKKVVKAVLGDPVERALSKYRDEVEKINALESAMQAMSDTDLRKKSDELRVKLDGGAKTDEVLHEAFALVREASVRTIGLRHYDVQLIGGIVLHEGKIAEMKTGEGKTLVATLPLYLNGLLGRGAHLVTPNDYLSKYGLQQMGPIYHMLGLSAAVIQNAAGNPDAGSFLYDPDYDSDDERFQNLRPITRREAYQADILYGTNNEFGFDYLRDNMVMDSKQISQREMFYAIVDEVDNILIDEARTPLIISGPSDPPSHYYKVFADVVRRLKPSSQDSVDEEEPDGDFVVDIKDRVAFLTEAGVEKIEKILNIDQLFHPDNAEMIPYLDNSLRAYTLYHRDKEYIVEQGQVVIVDEFTGRLMHGRRFSEGLHQAIEAKEGVEIRRENMTMATITFQNFFRMYKKLAGMTGTALTEAEEFEKIYDLEVVAIPTNLPIVRDDKEDLIYTTEAAKFRAVVNEIKERQEHNQPVLVGTVAVETSERLGKLLSKAGVEHEVLNAKNHEREASIIAQAGRPGAVTIATNMAGRGVDILLGGNPEGLARDRLRKQGIEITQATDEQWEAALAEAEAECAEDRKKVIAAGGLCVIGTERHEARRIDNQLRGRSGRQGDPGESRFFLSLEDELMRRFQADRVKQFMSWANIPEDEPIEHNIITRSIAQAQVRVEGHNFDIRKRVLDYDDVVNKQREFLYRQRREVLAAEDMREQYLKILEEGVVDTVDQFVGDADDPDTWDLEALYRQLFTVFPVPEHIDPETMEEQSLDELENSLVEATVEAYDAKTEELGEDLMHRAERLVMLNTMDAFWRRHLTDLDMLREGIGLMAIAQRDPLVEYQRAAFGMWEDMQSQIRVKAAYDLLNVRVQSAQQQPVRRNYQAIRPSVNDGATATSKPETVRKSSKEKLGRNDPCWCGSGKKYKQCHMKQDQRERRERMGAD